MPLGEGYGSYALVNTIYFFVDDYLLYTTFS